MKFIEHPKCNGVLRGEGEEVADLPALFAVDASYGPYIQSFWRPSPEELALLMNGGVVELTVIGRLHPPVGVAVVPPELGH